LKRFTSITMAVLFLLTVISGLAAWITHTADADLHLVLAILFILSAVTHIILNRKRALKRIVYIIYLAALPLAFFTGVVETHVHPGEAGTHIVVSLIFAVLMVAHIKANYKALARHFGWRRKVTE
jgi:hypothetical protein